MVSLRVDYQAAYSADLLVAHWVEKLVGYLVDLKVAMLVY
jgi:hypothetical protein